MSATLWKRPGVLLGAATVYVGSTTFAYLSFYEPKKDDASLEEISDARRMEVFNANASKYDKDVDFDEMLTGISLMRRFLLRSAKGKVLEIAAGTGRNLPYYASNAQLTLTDLSDGMLQQIPAKAKKQGLLTDCELRVMSASDLQFADDTFDTVVDTFGLCSMDDSVKALEEMQRVCKSDGTGKILLLEHGRSHYAWLSNVLDKFAAKHAQRWGCHWNKDILALVEQAGLEVETVCRFHFGTTYYIVAKPQGTSSSSTKTQPKSGASRTGASSCEWLVPRDASKVQQLHQNAPKAPHTDRQIERQQQHLSRDHRSCRKWKRLGRIKNQKGVEGYVIADRNGDVQMQFAEAEKYTAYIKELTTKVRGVVRDLNPKNGLQYMRIRIKKLELLIAHEKEFLVVVIQKWAPASA